MQGIRPVCSPINQRVVYECFKQSQQCLFVSGKNYQFLLWKTKKVNFTSSSHGARVRKQYGSCLQDRSSRELPAYFASYGMVLALALWVAGLFQSKCLKRTGVSNNMIVLEQPQITNYSQCEQLLPCWNPSKCCQDVDRLTRWCTRSLKTQQRICFFFFFGGIKIKWWREICFLRTYYRHKFFSTTQQGYYKNTITPARVSNEEFPWIIVEKLSWAHLTAIPF